MKESLTKLPKPHKLDKLHKMAGRHDPAFFKIFPLRQTRQLEAPKQGDGWVFLDRKQPADGDKPAVVLERT